MNELKVSLKGFFDKVLVVVLYLLSSLDIEEVVHEVGEAVNLFLFNLLIILKKFLNGPEISADSSGFWIDLEIPVHLENGFRIGPYSDVQQKGIPGV